MKNNYLEQKKNTHLYFQSGTRKYAVDSESVLEIMKLPALDYPQKLPNNVVGLLKYNNFVISVIDVRFYLDEEVSKYNVHNELLIVKTDETIFGIITDKVLGIAPFDSSKINTIPYADGKSIIESMYKFDFETIYIINVFALETTIRGNDINDTEDMKTLFPTDKNSVELFQKRALTISDKSKFKLASEELHVKNKYISFNLNKDSYCISLDFVKEVLKDTEITKIPGTPNFIEGIMNLRGDYITVINLKKFFGFTQETISDKKPVIIIKCNDLKLAFLIDKINELFEFQQESLIDTGEGYFSNEFIYNEKLYTVLNVERITADKKIIVTDM